MLLSGFQHLLLSTQGVKNAVPKTILQLMNVDGMTRENVASHLQKYRLYLKKLGGYPANAKTTPEALQQVQQVWHGAFDLSVDSSVHSDSARRY